MLALSSVSWNCRSFDFHRECQTSEGWMTALKREFAHYSREADLKKEHSVYAQDKFIKLAIRRLCEVLARP